MHEYMCCCFCPAVLLTAWQNSNWYVHALSERFLPVDKSVFLFLFFSSWHVFSCTFEPALSWFLVADQGSITSLFICWSCYSETASAPFLDAARRPPRCSLFREVGRTREGDRVDTRTEIEEGGEKSRWRNQCQAWSSFSPCIWRGGGSEVMVVDGREDEERWHWRTP